MSLPEQTIDFLYDEDGMIMALRKDSAGSPREAIRMSLEECDWLGEDIPCYWIEDQWMRPVLSEYRKLVQSVEVGWMRPAITEDEWSDLYQEETWVHCTETEPGAVEFWLLPFGG